MELGINLDEDPEFYWIAEESLVAPLPEGWVDKNNPKYKIINHKSLISPQKKKKVGK